MKVLITGGAGFIGSNLADRLLQRGDKVLVIDNFATGRRDNLKPHSNLEIVEGTISDEKVVDEAFERFRPDIVIHAAASYKDPSNWVEDARTNVVGSVNITKASQAFNARRLIYFQTALCYGLHPLEQPITLGHPIRPEGSSYAISKTAGEQYISLSDLNFISFRLANAYGPRNLSGPLPTFYHRLSNKLGCFVTETRRDFIFVEDLVDVVMKAVDGQGERGYYHISSGSDYSIKELYDETVRAMELSPYPQPEIKKPLPDDVFSILLDPSKTNLTFDWKVKTQLRDGVQKTISYYKKFGISETYTHLKSQEK